MECLHTMARSHSATAAIEARYGCLADPTEWTRASFEAFSSLADAVRCTGYRVGSYDDFFEKDVGIKF